MNLKDIVLSEIHQSQKDKYCTIPLTFRMVRSIEIESVPQRMGEMRIIVYRGAGVQFCKKKRV